jgi:DNA-binding NarL/FixJ family response regulator
VAAGELVAARTALDELVGIAETFDTPVLQATVLATRGRVELAEGSEAASVTLQAAVDAWQALDVPYEVASVLTLLGQALRAGGDEAGAGSAFSRAVDLFEQIGAHLDARRVLGGSHPVLPDGLTAREVEVLGLIAAGKSNAEIAADLYLSVKTVSRHLSNIFTKISVTSRAAATAYAFEHDLT